MREKYSDRHYPKDIFKTLDNGIRMMVDAAYEEGFEDGVKTQPARIELVPDYSPVEGACGRCGAPWAYPSGPWFGVVPPQPIPSCNCWNKQTWTTTNTGGGK